MPKREVILEAERFEVLCGFSIAESQSHFKYKRTELINTVRGFQLKRKKKSNYKRTTASLLIATEETNEVKSYQQSTGNLNTQVPH